MTVRIPTPDGPNTSEAYTIDFRETAPAAANAPMYVGRPMDAVIGGLSVGVPGELRGLEEMHRRWGSLSWKELVEPSVELAKGWKVSKELERRIEMFDALMHNSPDWKAIFAPKGCLLREGDVIRRVALSRTLATIAEEGPGAFYSVRRTVSINVQHAHLAKGPIAESLVQKIQRSGGIMTLQDFADYSVIVRPALEGSYRGKKVYTTHAPTSGPVLLHMLNLLEQFGDFVEGGRTSLNMHRVIEIMKCKSHLLVLLSMLLIMELV